MFKVMTRFEAVEVRLYCIKNNFYTLGNCDEYEEMLDFVRAHETNPGIEDVEWVAENIYNHSALGWEYDGYTGKEIIKNIMFGLLNDCMKRFAEEE